MDEFQRARAAASRAARRARQPWLIATVGFTAAFFAVTWPLLTRFGSATYGGPGDGWALIWQTRFRVDNGLSYFSPTYGREIGWPVGGELTSSLLMSNATVELPHAALLTIGIPDVPAYNLIVLAAAVTSSLAMYGVLRRLECRPFVAFWGGLVFLLAPWHLVKLSIHPTLASMAALPLVLLGIVEWARKPSVASGALLAGAAALATYTHSYYGIGTGVVLVAAIPTVIVAAYVRRSLSRTLPETAVLGGVLALIPVPLALALATQSSEVSVLLDRPLYVFELAARLRYWLTPSVDNRFFGEAAHDFLTGRGPLNDGELALYLGLVTIALAVVSVIAAILYRRQRLAVAVAATMAFTGAVLSFPAITRIPFTDVGVRMPVAYLNDYLSFISTPARFFAFTLTGFVVMGALGLQFLTTKIRPSLALALVTGACLASAIELPLQRDGQVVSTGPTELVKSIERRIPKDEPIAQYPSAENFYLPIARQVFYQVEHRRSLLNGAPATSLEDAVRMSVEDPSDPATPGKLALLGYRYAAYDLGQGVERAALIGRPMTEALSYGPPKGFTVIERVRDGSLIMRVTADPATALVSLGVGWSRAGRWLSRSRGTMLACATAGGQHTLRFRVSAFGEPRVFVIGDSDVIVVPGPEKSVRARVTLQPGWQLLTVRLIGSTPTRPSDVIKGEPDSRPLAVSIGPISVSGPKGPSDVCAGPTRLENLPTVG